uniref:Uncharacterized protein n=1 Tax=Oncorhynchus kisutch TaxID=8019 RepID=A0A8C7MMG6_ONCKI
MTEDHGLSDGDGSVDVAEGHELLLFAVTEDVVLLDGVQRLLLPFQLDDVGVWDDALGKVPHRLLKRGREQQHLKTKGSMCVPLNAYTLVLMTLCSDHDVSFVQDKHFDLLGVDELELQTPVQHGAWRPYHNLLLDRLTFVSSDGGQLIGRRHTESLGEERNVLYSS